MLIREDSSRDNYSHQNNRGHEIKLFQNGTWKMQKVVLNGMWNVLLIMHGGVNINSAIYIHMESTYTQSYLNIYICDKLCQRLLKEGEQAKICIINTHVHASFYMV